MSGFHSPAIMFKIIPEDYEDENDGTISDAFRVWFTLDTESERPTYLRDQFLFSTPRKAGDRMHDLASLAFGGKR